MDHSKVSNPYQWLEQLNDELKQIEFGKILDTHVEDIASIQCVFDTRLGDHVWFKLGATKRGSYT